MYKNSFVVFDDVLNFQPLTMYLYLTSWDTRIRSWYSPLESFLDRFRVRIFCPLSLEHLTFIIGSGETLPRKTSTYVAWSILFRISWTFFFLPTSTLKCWIVSSYLVRLHSVEATLVTCLVESHLNKILLRVATLCSESHALASLMVNPHSTITLESFVTVGPFLRL